MEALVEEPKKTQKQNKMREIKRMADEYETAFFLVLNATPAWKREVLINNLDESDRIWGEFCKEVCALAENGGKI